MSNPYGWGQNEPQIKPKDQGGDTIATFSQKIYNLFNNLFDTLNSYPWSTATRSDAGYMSAADKAALDDVSNTYLPLTGGTLTGNLTLFQVLAFSSSNPVVNSGGNDRYLRLGNGDSSTLYANGASLYLYGAATTGETQGGFNLQTFDGANRSALMGRPDGTLTWGGKNVATIQTGTWTPVIDGRGTPGTVTKSFSKSIYVKNGPLVYCVVSGVYGPITGGSGSVVLRSSSFPYTIEGKGLSGTMFWSDKPYPMYYYTNDLIYFRKTDTLTDLLCSDISSSKTFTMAFVYHTTD